MNGSILNIEIQEFINNNLNSEITSILLKGTSFDNVQTKEIIEQIEAKKKCENKLPLLVPGSSVWHWPSSNSTAMIEMRCPFFMLQQI